MIDSKIFTFLELCNEMNYHKTAENLNMTQPAVTQHIKYLEQFYGCKLFNYSKKKLSKTQKGTELEKYARAIVAQSNTAAQVLKSGEKVQINIGATKTIGEYMLDNVMETLFSSNEIELNITIDNTKRLLEKLNRFELELLLLEGYVDKEKYGHIKISSEEVVGICAKTHAFAGKEVTMKQVFAQNIVLRERGSGTRAVFENFLFTHGYNVGLFANKSEISSNRLIELAVQSGRAISFVYNIVPKNNKNLAVFRIKNSKILHEFNYIYLSEERAKRAIKALFANAQTAIAENVPTKTATITSDK